MLTVVQNLYHNTPGGKLNRGMSVVDTVEILQGRSLTEQEYLKAAILGWCVELVRSFERRRDIRSVPGHKLTDCSSRLTSSSPTT